MTITVGQSLPTEPQKQELADTFNLLRGEVGTLPGEVVFTYQGSEVPMYDRNGEGAVTYITNTTPVTGLSARHVVCLTDTQFTTFTRTNSTGSITGVMLPAGTLLIGPVTAITLASGAVAAYT